MTVFKGQNVPEMEQLTVSANRRVVGDEYTELQKSPQHSSPQDGIKGKYTSKRPVASSGVVGNGEFAMNTPSAPGAQTMSVITSGEDDVFQRAQEPLSRTLNPSSVKPFRGGDDISTDCLGDWRTDDQSTRKEDGETPNSGAPMTELEQQLPATQSNEHSMDHDPRPSDENSPTRRSLALNHFETRDASADPVRRSKENDQSRKGDEQSSSQP